MKNYFTFPDGALRYDCRPCGACCKGLGIGLDMVAGDLDRIEAVAPGIAAFVRRRGPAWTAFNPRGGCWFLETDGLCKLERDHGRDHKPAVCRLFPFNRVFVAGDYRVIDFNSVVCPLEPAAGDGVRHAELLAELDGIRDPAIAATALPDGAAAIIALEAATTPEFDTSPGVDALFGQARTPGDATHEAATLVLRSLRFNELFGPRSWAPPATIHRLLPSMSRGWMHLLAVGEDLAQRPLGMQESTSVWSETVSLTYLLARWSEPAWIAVDSLSVPDDPEVLGIAKELRRNHRRRAPLGEVLGPAMRGRPLRDRVVLMRNLEPLLPHVRFGGKKRR